MEEKSEELSQEVALRSQNGIAIYLIGMMASGKSIVGREVAKALNYKFFDRYHGSVILVLDITFLSVEFVDQVIFIAHSLLKIYLPLWLMLVLCVSCMDLVLVRQQR